MADMQKLSRQMVEYAERFADITDAAKGRGRSHSGGGTTLADFAGGGRGPVRALHQQADEGCDRRGEVPGVRPAGGPREPRPTDVAELGRPQHAQADEPERPGEPVSDPPQDELAEVDVVPLTGRRAGDSKPELVAEPQRESRGRPAVGRTRHARVTATSLDSAHPRGARCPVKTLTSTSTSASSRSTRSTSTSSIWKHTSRCAPSWRTCSRSWRESTSVSAKSRLTLQALKPRRS